MNAEKVNHFVCAYTLYSHYLPAFLIIDFLYLKNVIILNRIDTIAKTFYFENILAMPLGVIAIFCFT